MSPLMLFDVGFVAGLVTAFVVIVLCGEEET